MEDRGHRPEGGRVASHRRQRRPDPHPASRWLPHLRDFFKDDVDIVVDAKGARARAFRYVRNEKGAYVSVDAPGNLVLLEGEAARLVDPKWPEIRPGCCRGRLGRRYGVADLEPGAPGPYSRCTSRQDTVVEQDGPSRSGTDLAGERRITLWLPDLQSGLARHRRRGDVEPVALPRAAVAPSMKANPPGVGRISFVLAFPPIDRRRPVARFPALLAALAWPRPCSQRSPRLPPPRRSPPQRPPPHPDRRRAGGRGDHPPVRPVGVVRARPGPGAQGEPHR